MSELIRVTREEILAAYTKGCEECRKTGSAWQTLRMCLNCGKVGCCDSSPNQHASKHWQEAGHNVMRGIMPGDSWTYDFATGVTQDAEYRQ